MKYLFLACLFISSTALAETYKWEDKDGLHFTENLSSVPKKYRAKAIAEASGDINGSVAANFKYVQAREPEQESEYDKEVKASKTKQRQVSNYEKKRDDKGTIADRIIERNSRLLKSIK